MSSTTKKLTVKDQLNFIINNDPNYLSHEIEELYKKQFCHALSLAMPYTHFSGGKNYLLSKYAIDYNSTVANEQKRFENYITGHIGITLDEFKLYYYHSSLIESYSFRKSDKKDQYSASDKAYTNIHVLIQFLIIGKYYDNLAVSNDFLTAKNIGYFTAAYEYTTGNISVKKFQNGRIDIKGLTPEQEQIIDKIFALHEKLRRYL